MRNRAHLRAIFIAALLIGLSIAPFIEIYAANNYVPSRWSDFYSPWLATKEAIRGENPYSEKVTQDIQTWFYGHPLTSSDPHYDLQAFVYPATAIPLIVPFTWMPWELFRMCFFALTPPLVFASCLYWVRWSQSVHGRALQWIVAFMATESVPSFWGIHTSQPTILIFIGITAVIALISRGRYELAGAVLALVSVKPNLVFLLTIWLLIVMSAHRRWRFILSFGAVFTLLNVSAEIIVPAWPWKWYQAVVVYGHRKVPTFSIVFGHYGTSVAVIAGLALLMALYRQWSTDPQSHGFRLSICAILAYTVCVIPNDTWMVYNQILLIPPILILLPRSNDSEVAGVARSIAIALTWMTILIVPVSATAIAFQTLTHSPLWVQVLAERLPFCNFLLPLAVLAAILSRSLLKATEETIIMQYSARHGQGAFSEPNLG